MINKNILLTILPPFWPKLPPLGINCLYEYLQSAGISTDIIDINNFFFSLFSEDFKKEFYVSCNTVIEKNMFSFLEKHHPLELNKILHKMASYDIIGFSCFKSNLAATIEFAKKLNKINPEMKIIFGGPEMARLYFKTSGKFNTGILNYADLIIAGEGEKPLLDYLTGKIKNKSIISFSELDSLHNLPFPKYKTINLENYPQRQSISLLSSRGCIKSCSFCSERLLYKKFRSYPAENTLKEISYHKTNNNIEHFVFFDSLINADLKKLENICDGIITQFGSVKWEAQIYIRNDMSIELLKKIKKSGCCNLFVGLESGSDSALKRMNKGFTSSDASAFFQKLKKAGLQFGISIIIGYPGETHRDFQESLDFVIKNQHLIGKIEQINPFTYYDGTNTDKNADYKMNPESLERMNIFIDQIKKNKFKYTNAFLGNLVEK